MLSAASAAGRPVIALFILDPLALGYGAAARWRLGAALADFARQLEALGLPLLVRRGEALAVLRAVLAESGADTVWWQRDLDPAAIARDGAVKAALKAGGVAARSFAGQVLFEPWTVQTGQGGPYRVFTPFWKALRSRAVAPPLPAITRLLRGPVLRGETPQSLGLGAAMRRGGPVVEKYARIGAAQAEARLARFLAGACASYPARRDDLDPPGTSELSEHLAWGEISPVTLWHAGFAAMAQGNPGAEAFLRQLAWREFAWHLLYHFPRLGQENWRPEWNGFAWRADNDDAEAWRRGQTGEPLVDAAMREMFTTGRMHNRARMIAASYLTKHLLTDWRVGLAWFAECLIDHDPAANALGWQWVAGSGPDAAPYFRIFNPAAQARKFDPQGGYRRAWLVEAGPHPPQTALDFLAAAPRAWQLWPGQPAPPPRIDLAQGRLRALAAYAGRAGAAP